MNIKNLLFKPIIMICFLSVTGVVLAKDGSRADHSEHKSRANHSEHKSRTDHSKHSSKTDHFSVKFAGTKIVAIDFIRGKDGKHTHRAFPHGYEMVRFATTTKNYTPRQFKSLMKQRLAAIKEHKAPKTVAVAGRSAPTISSSATVIAPAAATATADCTTNSPTGTSTCTTGMAAGFNTSTGFIANSTCYNYTTTGTDAPTISSSTLSVVSSLSSTAQMLNVTASINGAYGLFSASEAVSFSDSSSSAVNSGQIFMNAGSIYSLQNTLDTTTPLSGYGQQEFNNLAGFDTNCGNSFLGSVNAGVVVTAQITWSSSSAATSSNISSATNACYGIDCINLAVSTANSSSTVQTNFDVTDTIFGGGDAVINAWFQGADNLSGNFVPGVSVAPTTTDQTNCFATPTSTNSAAITTACSSYGDDLKAAATNALALFVNANSSTSTSVVTDLGDFSVFPNGVQGFALSAPLTSTNPLPSSISGSITDLFSPYTAQI